MKRQSKRQSSHWIHLALSLCLAGAWLGVSDRVLAQEQPVGKVIGISGSVDYLAGGGDPSMAEVRPGEIRPAAFEPGWEKVGFHQPVFISDQFRTARKSRLKILLKDNSLITLGPSSQLRVKSYIVNPRQKLRQGVVNVMHGLSMFIVNKSQSNKNSSFRIVTPTANLAARGTQGFLSVTNTKTLLALKSGELVVRNADPKVLGEVILKAMMKTVIAKGKAPTPPEPLTLAELNIIENIIMAWVGSRYGGAAGEEQLQALLNGEYAQFGTSEEFEEVFHQFDVMATEACTGG